MEILIRPIVTEKLTAQGESLNRYGFMVDPRANKLQVKKAVEELYGVTVDSVNTLSYAGKVSSRFTKAGYIKGRKNAFKKAIITLKEGEKIDFYSNI
ncbi:MAG: 50S ribosomal protein L23 [Bacteroidales bacterium]|jgi:large subunit ribosomal protein L23|nr:50S ribosomal protein L23 [Bacteroidales bacterium]